MYVSDYGFAAGPSAWTTVMNSYGSSSISSINWLSGIDEWTITPSGGIGNVLSIEYDFGVVSREVTSVTSIRPTFYLNSDVYYLSGLGTRSNPIHIS